MKKLWHREIWRDERERFLTFCGHDAGTNQVALIAHQDDGLFSCVFRLLQVVEVVDHALKRRSVRDVVDEQISVSRRRFRQMATLHEGKKKETGHFSGGNIFDLSLSFSKKKQLLFSTSFTFITCIASVLRQVSNC